MSKIKQLFEQEILKKIQASNELDKKLEASRLGFNKGISYLENLCEELQTHIPTLGCQLKINDSNKSKGHFIFDANNCRIPIQLWGEYDEEGGLFWEDSILSEILSVFISFIFNRTPYIRSYITFQSIKRIV